MTNEEISLRTKRSLAEALKNTMKTKKLSKITISELIAACDINRKTFYYHFPDVYALLAWTLEQEAIDIVTEFDLVTDTEEAIRFVMDYAEKNDYIIIEAFDTIGYKYIKEFFHDDFFPIFQKAIQGSEKELDVSLTPSFREFLVEFYTDAAVGLLIEWAKNRMHQDKETVLKDLSLIYRVTIPAILEAKRTQ